MVSTDNSQGGGNAQTAWRPASNSCTPLLTVLAGRIQTLLERVEYIEERLQTLSSASPNDAINGGRTNQRIIVGSLLIDHDARRVFLGDTEIYLSPTEYRLLHELARNAGKVVLYRDLMRRTRGGYAPDSRYLKVYVGRVRAKIAPHAEDSPCQVETVRGVGYRLVA
ncbi:MAG: winged helix-turn-helix domain-containing protein [Dehalococcoidia bacterium]